MTAFDESTEAFLRARKGQPQERVKPWRGPPPENLEAIKAHIEKIRGRKFFNNATTIAEDLHRDGLWPNANPQDVADWLGIERLGGRVT